MLLFYCVYIPSSSVERMSFLNTLSSVLQSVDVDEYLILGGDFICTKSNLDRNHMEPHLPSCQRLVQLKRPHMN